MKRLFVACLVLVAFAPAPVAQARYARAVLLFNLQDPVITESSGVASSSYSNDVIFTHNDSGDYSRFFAIGPKGRTIGTYSVVGAGFADWEDMVRGPAPGGGSVLWFADIGDNYAPQPTRPFVTLYAVAEPRVDPKTPAGDVAVPVTDFGDFVYEDGPHNSETLLVHPKTGDLVTVGKEPSGDSGVFVAEPVIPGINVFRRVATIPFSKLARPRQPTDFDATSRLLTTGGDISPDGRRLVIRTYVEAFEWDISKGLVAGLRRKPARIPLPFTKQGEAIGYTRDGRSLITTSEQLPAPVHLIRG